MSDVEKLLEILGKLKSSFYHFTDVRNLPSIRNHGILSMRAMRQMGSLPTAPGGNAWSQDADIGSGMDGYVHLCFFDEHPMEWLAKQDGRIERSVFLEISPEILLSKGVLITDGVANKSTVTPKPADEMIRQLDLDVIYNRTDWRDPEIQKAAQSCKIMRNTCAHPCSA